MNNGPKPSRAVVEDGALSPRATGRTTCPCRSRALHRRRDAMPARCTSHPVASVGSKSPPGLGRKFLGAYLEPSLPMATSRRSAETRMPPPCRRRRLPPRETSRDHEVAHHIRLQEREHGVRGRSRTVPGTRRGCWPPRRRARGSLRSRCARDRRAEKVARGLTVVTRPKPHRGAVRHSVPEADPEGPPIGKPFAALRPHAVFAGRARVSVHGLAGNLAGKNRPCRGAAGPYKG